MCVVWSREEEEETVGMGVVWWRTRRLLKWVWYGGEGGGLWNELHVCGDRWNGLLARGDRWKGQGVLWCTWCRVMWCGAS